MKYEDIKSPHDLLKYMDEHVQYGFKDEDGNIYTLENEEDFEEGVTKYWKLAAGKELIEREYGHCFDQVEFERFWFRENGYRVHTMFIMFCLEEENPYTMHTYLIYEDGEKFCLFEHSDGPRKGIQEFDSMKDAVFYQMRNHLLINNDIKKLKKNEIESLHVYEYDEPSAGIGMYEFMDHVLESGREIL